MSEKKHTPLELLAALLAETQASRPSPPAKYLPQWAVSDPTDKADIPVIGPGATGNFSK
jgi:hypothetical protein